MDLATITNTILGIGTILIEALSLLLVVMLITKDRGPLAEWFGRNALVLVLVVMGGAMLGSLWYSEVIGYLPCLMCWYQRIAIYGIAIIAFIALVKKHGKEVWVYINTLSVLGALVATFHVFSRFAKVEVFDCSAVGPSCLQELFKVFGYIDIPVMSLSALIFILLLNLNRKRFIR